MNTDTMVQLQTSLSGWLPAVTAQAWQLTLLIVVVAIIVWTWARRRAHLAHALWLVVLLKCVTPPIISSPTGIFCWLPRPHIEGSLLGSSTVPPEQQANPFAVEFAQASSHSESQTSADDSLLPLVGDIPADLSVDGAAAPIVHSSGQFHSNWRSVTGTALGIAWLAGIGLACIVSAGRWRRCFRALYGPQVVHPQTEQMMADLSRRFGVRQCVRLKITRDTIGPAVVGLWRPTIILPEVIVRGTALGDLEPILAHELLHIRRGDLWVSCLQLAAQWLWWWHPLVWWANRLITRESERCCDEGVLAELACPPLRYAKCLVDVLELKSLVSIPAFPGVRPVDITSSRLEQIMQAGEKSRKRSPWWCWLVLGVAGCVVLPGAALIGAADVQAAARAVDDPPVSADITLTLQAPATGSEATARGATDRSPAEPQVITLRVANGVQGLRFGKPVEILFVRDLYAKHDKADPRLTVTNAESCLFIPTFDQVLNSLPADAAGGPPFIADVKRQNVRVAVEPIVISLGESRFYPLVGQARHYRCHFKCTVIFEKVTRSDWPVPFLHTESVQEVVYIDRDHLLHGDAAETVQLVSIIPYNTEGGAYEIRVVAQPEQAVRLQEGMESGRLLVYQSGAPSRHSATTSDEGPPESASQKTPARGERNGWSVKVNVLSFDDSDATVDINLEESVADDQATTHTRRTHTLRRIPVGKTVRVFLDNDQERSLEMTIADPAQLGKPVLAIVIVGNKSIATEEIMKQIKTRTGRVIDPRQLKEDVRALLSTGRIRDVKTSVQESDHGNVLIIQVVEKPVTLIKP